MKNYNKTFTYQLSVDVVAKALLEVLNRAEPSCCVDSNCSDEELKEYQEQADKNAAYYTRLAECIIDPIQDNAQALGDLYNSLNGWVKTDSPLDTIDLRKKDNHVPFPAEQVDEQEYTAKDFIKEFLTQANKEFAGDYKCIMVKGEGLDTKVPLAGYLYGCGNAYEILVSYYNSKTNQIVREVVNISNCSSTIVSNDGLNTYLTTLYNNVF